MKHNYLNNMPLEQAKEAETKKKRASSKKKTPAEE